jgi:hypothetical protein
MTGKRAEASTAAPGRVRSGDLWRLGRHRLLCGDATDPAQVARLFRGGRASLAVTSPPYNLGHGIAAHSRKGGWRAPAASKYAARPDRLPEAAYADLLVRATENALAVSDALVVNLQQVAGNKVALMEYLHRMRHHLADTAVWDKGSVAPALARNVMSSRFEFLFFFAPGHRPTRAIPTAAFRGTVPNVYRGPIQRRNAYSGVHAATFPLHLPSWLIRTFDATGGTVFDPFLGTGTTLMAADDLGRACYGIEIEPSYCDIALSRWEQASGGTAERIGG